jgi:hypothetical protein
LRFLGEYFARNGFDRHWDTDAGGIHFERKDRFFLEIGYDPESSPNYTPTIIFGIGGKFDEKGNPNCIPLWFITPENSLARSYSKWKFSSEDQLEKTLLQIRAEVIEKYAAPLWKDASLLKEKIRLFNEQEPI